MSDFYTDKNKIVKEQKEIIGIVPVVDMKNLIKGIFICLASESPIIYFTPEKYNIKTACLPLDYLESIQTILYAQNGWGIEFTEIINTYSYYEYQIEWEEKFKKKIKEVLKELNKEYKYDIEKDYIQIEFTQEEIDSIYKNYDKDTITIIKHFTSLLVTYSYTRVKDLSMKNYKIECNRNKYEEYNQKLNIYYDNKKQVKKLDKEFENSIYKYY